MSASIAKERVICEFWSSAGESNGTNELAGKLPFGLGLFIYAPMYVLKALRIGSVIRYTLTTKNIRVEKGMTRKTVRSIPLENVSDARVTNFVPFTRTGNIELVGSGGVMYTMAGIQDPHPAAKTILDAVRALVSVQRVLKEQQAAKPAAV